MSPKSKAEAIKKQLVVFNELLKKPENKYCADCKKTTPTWASVNLGVFVCINCSGCHREIGVHITKIRSTNLDVWPKDILNNFKLINNQIANKYWECKLKNFDFKKIQNDKYKLVEFIRNKYEYKKWVDPNKKMDPMTLIMKGKIKKYKSLYCPSEGEEEEENTQKKKYLIKKNSKNEELFLYIGELDLYNGINGYGELYLKNGKKYEGIFINGKLNGYGRLIDSLKMRCYEGNFKDNELLDGKGKIIDIKDDGSKIVYEGDIKNMKKQGKGTEKTKNNNYEGDFSDDLKHGKGKIIFINEGEYYEGDFNQGKMTGNGFIKFKDKSFYQGEFLDGNMHGKGTFTWPDGTMYEGQYANNLREGFGEYRWKMEKYFKECLKKGNNMEKEFILKMDKEKKLNISKGKK